MLLDIIDEEEDFFILRFPSFSGKKINIPFTATNEIDTIMVIPGKDNFGIYNIHFRENAIKNNIWGASLYHEALHCIPEFFAPWYAPIDILPEKYNDSYKSLIPNVIEDIAINHTLWLWEVNPIRSAGYTMSNVTEKLIQYYDNFLYDSNMPSPLVVIQEFIGRIHFENLKLISCQRKGLKKNVSHVHLKNDIYVDIKSLSGQINNLINTLAVSLTKENRYVTINLEVNPGEVNRPPFEAQYEGKTIPQFVTLNQNIISKIYDLLDIHFSEAYNIDVMKLRKDAYENYKKTILVEKKRLSKKINNVKSFRFDFKKRIEKNKYVVDFYFDIIDKKSIFKKTNKPDNDRIKFEQKVEQWERFTRMKSSELLRLKKWVE